MASDTELNTELETLSKRLEDRHSMVHFAWCFGLACVAFVTTGVALKLFHDSERTPKVAFVLLTVGLGCTAAAAIRLQRGLKLYGTELRDFTRLTELRALLGLDRPQLPSA